MLVLRESVVIMGASMITNIVLGFLFFASSIIPPKPNSNYRGHQSRW